MTVLGGHWLRSLMPGHRWVSDRRVPACAEHRAPICWRPGSGRARRL